MIKHFKKILHFSILSLSFIGLAACDNKRIFESWEDVKTLEWHKDSTYAFTFDLNNTTSQYNFNFGIRNTNLYPYQNLWILTELQGPNHYSHKDTIKIILADHTGVWYGKRSASFYSYTTSLYKNLSFTNPGKYTMYIKHGMRKDQLSGVASLGLRVEHSK